MNKQNEKTSLSNTEKIILLIDSGVPQGDIGISTDDLLSSFQNNPNITKTINTALEQLAFYAGYCISYVPETLEYFREFERQYTKCHKLWTRFAEEFSREVNGFSVYDELLKHDRSGGALEAAISYMNEYISNEAKTVKAERRKPTNSRPREPRRILIDELLCCLERASDPDDLKKHGINNTHIAKAIVEILNLLPEDMKVWPTNVTTTEKKQALAYRAISKIKNETKDKTPQSAIKKFEYKPFPDFKFTP